MDKLINLNSENIVDEHICCAFSDKKCKDSYQAKKDWLTQEFNNGYIFKRIDARAKVFIEYGPAEMAWVPIKADNYLNINCFWVSGKYKKNGYGKELIRQAMDDAQQQEKFGLVTIVGTKKFHFMSDGKWLLRQGFEEVAKTETGFSLLVKKIDSKHPSPSFKQCVLKPKIEDQDGIVVYYSNRCPFSEFHALNSLTLTANNRNIPYKVIKLSTMEEAQNAPSPGTIFSLFLNGKFITTDVSICLDTRYDKVMAKHI